jgi:hypothetical protein
LAWEPYEEKYFFRITDIWQYNDGTGASGKPSKWEYTTNNLAGH